MCAINAMDSKGMVQVIKCDISQCFFLLLKTNMSTKRASLKRKSQSKTVQHVPKQVYMFTFVVLSNGRMNKTCSVTVNTLGFSEEEVNMLCDDDSTNFSIAHHLMGGWPLHARDNGESDRKLADTLSNKLYSLLHMGQYVSRPTDNVEWLTKYEAKRITHKGIIMFNSSNNCVGSMTVAVELDEQDDG